jgi:hypothetical protein
MFLHQQQLSHAVVYLNVDLDSELRKDGDLLTANKFRNDLMFVIFDTWHGQLVTSWCRIMRYFPHIFMHLILCVIANKRDRDMCLCVYVSVYVGFCCLCVV